MGVLITLETQTQKLAFDLRCFQQAGCSMHAGVPASKVSRSSTVWAAGGNAALTPFFPHLSFLHFAP